jgi:circadian clock protein KaiC
MATSFEGSMKEFLVGKPPLEKEARFKVGDRVFHEGFREVTIRQALWDKDHRRWIYIVEMKSGRLERVPEVELIELPPLPIPTRVPGAKKEEGKPKRPKEERKPVVKKPSFFARLTGAKEKRKEEGKPKRPKEERKRVVEKPTIKEKEIVKIGVPKEKAEGKPKRPKEERKPVVKKPSFFARFTGAKEKKKEKGKPKRPKEERKLVVKKPSFFARLTGAKEKKKEKGKPKRPKEERKLVVKKPTLKEKEIVKIGVPKREEEGKPKRPKEERKLVVKKPTIKEIVKIGVPGFDQLFHEGGVIRGTSILVAGGPGTGKTIFTLQTLYNAACEGHDCIYLTLEEAPERLFRHLLDFGFKVEETKRDGDSIFLRAGKGRLVLKRLEPISIARSVEALLEKVSGRLSMDSEIVLDLIPPGFSPYMLGLDSISAMETAFSGRLEQYRIYIEQLFRYFETLTITSFLIAETEDAPVRFSKTGVEEFLADGIIAFYYYKAGPGRIRAVEIVKMRGSSHSPRIVPLYITKHGLVVSPSSPSAEITAKKAAFASALQSGK